MHTFEINDTPVKLYTDWNEVPLMSAVRFMCLEEPTNEAEFIRYQQDVVFSLSDLNGEIYGSLPHAVIAECYEYMQPMITTMPTPEPIKSFTFEDVVYSCAKSGFTADKAYWPLKDVTTDEMINALAYNSAMVEQGKAAKGLMASLQYGDFAMLPLLIGTLYRPEGELYDAGKAEERAQLFERLPFVTAYAAFLFFCPRLASFTAGSEAISSNSSLPQNSSSTHSA